MNAEVARHDRPVSQADSAPGRVTPRRRHDGGRSAAGGGDHFTDSGRNHSAIQEGGQSYGPDLASSCLFRTDDPGLCVHKYRHRQQPPLTSAPDHNEVGQRSIRIDAGATESQASDGKRQRARTLQSDALADERRETVKTRSTSIRCSAQSACIELAGSAKSQKR